MPKYVLDPVLHQPVRTRLVAFLAARGEATFKELRAEINLTDGNLDAHIRKLTGVGYLFSRKESGNGRSQTFYSLTSKGKRSFARYVNELERLLAFGQRK